MNKIEPLLKRAGIGRGSPGRKIIIAIIGTTVLIFGIVLIVLPGPAVIVIPIGLAILATEFIWAQRLIERGRAIIKKLRGRGKEPTQ
jgi:tellurite resistance protein TerC